MKAAQERKDLRVTQAQNVSSQQAPVEPARRGRRSDAGVRARLRRTPGGALFLKGAVFVVGLLFILLGVVLAALPGPLTIPPILLGLYVWSSEFAWADRLLQRAKRSAKEAWEHAKRRPVVTALVTISGLVAVGVGVWLVQRYELVDRAKEALGL